MTRAGIALAALGLALAGSLAVGPGHAAGHTAAPRWNDGTPVTSRLTDCVLGIQKIGAMAYAGFQADPASPPRAGQVFYGHVVLGAATGACAGDQHAEVEVILPPGVTLAVDSVHPILCFHKDGQQATTAEPTCPARAVHGTYGPKLPAGNANAPWDLPSGRLLEIEFPLVSSRELKGPAGGRCPERLDELPIYRRNDCLIAAVHMADGDANPWLLPREQLVVAAAAP